jgi:hypothetical protein
VTLYLENTHHTKRAGEIAQGVGPEFKPSTTKKKKKEKKRKKEQPFLSHYMYEIIKLLLSKVN